MYIQYNQDNYKINKSKKTKSIIIIGMIITIIIGIIIGAYIISSTNNAQLEKCYIHYPYKDITLVLEDNWYAVNPKSDIVNFKKDINQSPQLIDNFTIQTHEKQSYHSLKLLINAYIFDLGMKGYKLIEYSDCTFLNDTIKEIYWIKYIKDNTVSEVFFLEHNDIIYSIISTYNLNPKDINDSNLSDLYGIIQKIY